MPIYGLASILLIFLSSVLHAKRAQHEVWYQEKVAELWGAQTEVRVPNGRVDILGANYATEVEFADKWKQAIGQALWYALQTGKKPGIVMICETDKDLMHVIRLRSVLLNAKLEIKVWVWYDGKLTE